MRARGGCISSFLVLELCGELRGDVLPRNTPTRPTTSSTPAAPFSTSGPSPTCAGFGGGYHSPKFRVCRQLRGFLDVRICDSLGVDANIVSRP